MGYINRGGEWVIEPIYENVTDFTSDGYALVAGVGEYYSLIDVSGELITEEDFIGCTGFGVNGWAHARERESWLCGYINTSGEWMIEPQFLKCYNFGSNGLAFAQDVETELFGYINTSGEWIIEPQFMEGANTFDPNFASNGLALVMAP